MTIINLRCEYLENPVGLDVAAPRLSWQWDTPEPDTRQTAYRLLVAADPAHLTTETALIWDSGRVEADASAHIAYAGPSLAPAQRVYWTVQAWDQAGHLYTSAQSAFWQMGLGPTYRWQAQWISYPTQVDEAVRPPGPAGADLQLFSGGDDQLNMRPPAYLQHLFVLAQGVRSAWLYITARGLYDAHLNSQPVTDARLTPGWTDYQHLLEYQTYDVTALLRPGQNTVHVILADGWYAGYLGPWGRRGLYGDTPALLLELHITLADGSQQVIASGPEWQGAEGPLRYAELYHGEYYDARRARFDWQPVTLAAPSDARLVGQATPPQRVTQTLEPVAIRQTQPGSYLVDMGQNMVGWLRLTVSGPAGTCVRLRHAEALLPDGRLDMVNLGPARATDTYILHGEGVERYEPRFTYHGFRYVEVSGHPGELTADALVGCVVHADLAQTGQITTASPLVDQVFANTYWSQRGNFNSVPTDCPQRAERLGWTGDMFTFARTGAYNMDCAAYYARWLHIVLREQSDEGGFPNVAPRAVLSMDGAPAWGDAGVWVTYLLYEQYGDRQIVEQAYPALTRWMAYIETRNPDGLWREGRQLDFGDWLSYNDFTPTDLLATAIWAMDARWMREMALAIGRADDAERWGALHQRISAAFVAAFVGADGRLHGDTQAAYVLALSAGVLPEAHTTAAVARLVELIAGCGWHPTTGFVATPLLLPVLSAHGQDAVAFRLLLQDTLPSWGYMIRQGATTIWERWDGDVEMRRIHGADTTARTFAHPVIGELIGMNSYNHFAFGAVAEWLYAYLLGIQPDPKQPGFKAIRIAPRTNGGLTHASGHYDSLYGRIRVAWRRQAGWLHTQVTIPANTSAMIRLESSAPASDAARYPGAMADDWAIIIPRGSGEYTFETRLSGG